MASAAARYDGHSEWYDEHFGSGHRPAEELAFLREALGTGHGQPCLDLACGTGLWAEPIAAAGYRVAGLDISAEGDLTGPFVGHWADTRWAALLRCSPGTARPAGRYGAISASVSGSMAASLAVRSAFRS